MKTAVLGAGSWGTALSAILADNGHDSWLWSRSEQTAEEMKTLHTNSRYLGSVELPGTLRATTDVSEALANADLVMFAVPSTSLRSVLQQVRDQIPASAILAHAIKGFDPQTLQRMSEVLQAQIGSTSDRICIISGPSHAEEVIARQPTTIVTSSTSRSTAEFVQDVLMNDVFRVYTNPDVIGTELGGSLKNIIAIGVGIVDGLGIGDNGRAALMTRGLAEISRLGVQMGASPLTFLGLSGVGDLIATCTSHHSRNFRAGQLLGKGVSLDSALKQIGMAVEGVQTVRSAVSLAKSYGVEMPITESLWHVLFGGLTPEQAASRLMKRDRNHEIEEVAKANLFPGWAPSS